MAETNAATLRDNPDIMELLELLAHPGFQSEQKEYRFLLDSVEAVIMQYNGILAELDALNGRLSKITDRKNPLHRMAESLGKSAADIGRQLSSIRENILSFTQNVLGTVKEKGLSALGSAFSVLHVRDNLQAVSRGLAKSVEGLDKAAARVAQLEEHSRQKSGMGEEGKAIPSAGSLPSAESIPPIEAAIVAANAQDTGLVELLADTRMDFENLPPEDLNAAYGRLLAIGMDSNSSLTVNELDCLQGLTGEAESLLSGCGRADTVWEDENELEEAVEIG